MIVLPRERPVLENLNTYYMDMPRFVEHCQGEYGSGCIHLQSPRIEGALFFDSDELLNSVFRDKDGELAGQAALDRLIETAAERSLTIHVYAIDPKTIYLWANLPVAREIQRDLNPELVDLDQLIEEMTAVELTGYIDVSINGGRESGVILFEKGEIIGGSSTWNQGTVKEGNGSQELLIQRVRQAGGLFRVGEISLPFAGSEGSFRDSGKKPSQQTIAMLEELLSIFERVVKANSKLRGGFTTMLKGKFVEKADVYTFLDPFIGEFLYSDRKISFAGEASDEELARGVFESVKELAEELGVIPQLRIECVLWNRKHKRALERFRIAF